MSTHINPEELTTGLKTSSERNLHQQGHQPSGSKTLTYDERSNYFQRSLF